MDIRIEHLVNQAWAAMQKNDDTEEVKQALKAAFQGLTREEEIQELYLSLKSKVMSQNSGKRPVILSNLRNEYREALFLRLHHDLKKHIGMYLKAVYRQFSNDYQEKRLAYTNYYAPFAFLADRISFCSAILTLAGMSSLIMIDFALILAITCLDTYLRAPLYYLLNFDEVLKEHFASVYAIRKHNYLKLQQNLEIEIPELMIEIFGDNEIMKQIMALRNTKVDSDSNTYWNDYVTKYTSEALAERKIRYDLFDTTISFAEKCSVIAKALNKAEMGWKYPAQVIAAAMLVIHLAILKAINTATKYSFLASHIALLGIYTAIMELLSLPLTIQHYISPSPQHTNQENKAYSMTQLFFSKPKENADYIILGFGLNGAANDMHRIRIKASSNKPEFHKRLQQLITDRNVRAAILPAEGDKPRQISFTIDNNEILCTSYDDNDICERLCASLEPSTITYTC